MSNSDNNSVNKPSVKLISRLASGEIPAVVEQAALVVEGEEQTDARFSYSPRRSVAFSSSTEGGQEGMQALSPPLTSAPDADDDDDESWLVNDDSPNFTKRPSLLDDEWPEEKEPTQRRSRRMSKWKFEQYECEYMYVFIQIIFVAIFNIFWRYCCIVVFGFDAI